LCILSSLHFFRGPAAALIRRNLPVCIQSRELGVAVLYYKYLHPGYTPYQVGARPSGIYVFAPQARRVLSSPSIPFLRLTSTRCRWRVSESAQARMKRRASGRSSGAVVQKLASGQLAPPLRSKQERTLGTRPLKNAPKPSCRAMLASIRKPLSGFSKLRFWMRVLITSSGAETTRDADAPAMDATKFWYHVALL
jgi:hypothetical protein